MNNKKRLSQKSKNSSKSLPDVHFQKIKKDKKISR